MKDEVQQLVSEIPGLADIIDTSFPLKAFTQKQKVS